MTTKTTRCAILAGAATLPALSLPAFALDQRDPVFAAIQEHRRRVAIHNAACAAVPRGDKLTPEIGKAEDYAGDLQSETVDQLGAILEMTPTTAAGCVAMLRFIDRVVQVDEYDAPLFESWCDRVSVPAKTVLSRIADALDKAVQS